MKKYRIRNYGTNGYVVQERTILFFWFPLTDRGLYGMPKVFKNVDNARDFVKKKVQKKKLLKKSKYVEYL